MRHFYEGSVEAYRLKIIMHIIREEQVPSYLEMKLEKDYQNETEEPEIKRIRQGKGLYNEEKIFLYAFDLILEFIGESYVWDILIRKVDFRTQMKLGQLNQRMAELVDWNAKYELKRLKKKIAENKVM